MNTEINFFGHDILRLMGEDRRRNLQCPSLVLHFLILSLCFIHKNEQNLDNDEIFFIL